MRASLTRANCLTPLAVGFPTPSMTKLLVGGQNPYFCILLIQLTNLLKADFGGFQKFAWNSGLWLWFKWAQFFESFQKFALNLGLWLWFELKHFFKATKKSALSHEKGLEVPYIPIPNPESLCLMPILTLIPLSKL